MTLVLFLIYLIFMACKNLALGMSAVRMPYLFQVQPAFEQVSVIVAEVKLVGGRLLFHRSGRYRRIHIQMLSVAAPALDRLNLLKPNEEDIVSFTWDHISDWMSHYSLRACHTWDRVLPIKCNPSHLVYRRLLYSCMCNCINTYLGTQV